MKRDQIIWTNVFREGGLTDMSLPCFNGLSINRSEYVTEYSNVKNAGIRLRAITHNREIETTPAQQREWDDRILIAEADFLKACIAAGMIEPDDTFTEISVNYPARQITAVVESGETLTVNV